MALPELVANSPTPGSVVALGTLSAAMTDTTGLSMSTSVVAPTALRAATGQFRVVVDSEVMLIAASAGGASPWTILTRGAEGSTAATHLIGAQIWHYLTAGALAALQSYYSASAGPVITTNQVAANPVFSNYLLAGDANPAFKVGGDGTLSWGAGGSTTPDTTLYRNAVNSALTVGGANLQIQAGHQVVTLAIAIAGALSNYLLATDSQPAFQIRGDGTMYWGPGGSTTLDVTLSRPAAGSLCVSNALSNANNVFYSSNTATSGFTGNLFAALTTQAAGTGFTIFNSSSNGVQSFYVRGDGHIYSTSATVTAISDRALKDDIRPLDGALKAIRALKPRKFRWNDNEVNGPHAGEEDFGFVSQEVEPVLPHLVDKFHHKGLDSDEHYQALRTGDLIPWLVGAVQELSAEVDLLKGAAHA